VVNAVHYYLPKVVKLILPVTPSPLAHHLRIFIIGYTRWTWVGLYKKVSLSNNNFKSLNVRGV